MLSIITYTKRINFLILFGREASKTSMCILLLLEVLDSCVLLIAMNPGKEAAWLV